MNLQGQQWIGSTHSRLGREAFQAVDPTSHALLDPVYVDATEVEIQQAMELATTAYRQIKRLPREKRAELLEAIAEEIEDLGEPLLKRASGETALPLPRLIGERGRTTAQMRLFADEVREGAWLDACIETAQPERQPIAKPDVRKMRQALGPVVVFGASNFPLAYSVAGGDTASALAAGCPVVVKAHPNHPGTSEMVAYAIARAVVRVGFPEGTFSMLHSQNHQVGSRLVTHPLTRAVGFTGSLRGGKALFDLAMARPEPIPVFAEMGSTNPVFLLPDMLQQDAPALAKDLAVSVTSGVGQFCTNPGLILTLSGESEEQFAVLLGQHLRDAPAGTMLHAGIRDAYCRGIHRLQNLAGLRNLVATEQSMDAMQVRATAFRADGATFLAHPELTHEVFGPVTLLVACADSKELLQVAQSLPGQLTSTLRGTAEDLANFDDLIDLLTDKVGRLLFSGVPTGVEVCSAMHHGGPFPATTDAASTAVGPDALKRFTRPICYQDAPQEWLPPELRDTNPDEILRRVDGRWSRESL